MTDTKDHSDRPAGEEAAAKPKASGRISVRIDTSEPEWGDPVCACEAEPYWLEVAEEQEQETKKEEEDSKP
ncbi:MAG: hypothetical protein AB7U81_00125 [Thiohalomonadaceae bacterium]